MSLYGKKANLVQERQEQEQLKEKYGIEDETHQIVHEWKCYIDVYSYTEKKGQPMFEKIQSVETAQLERGSSNATSALSFSEDHRYLLSTVAGDNSAVLFSVDESTGMLTKIFCLPISGEYPKDAILFPNNKFLVSLNHESNDMTFFHVDVENGTMIMNGPPIEVNVPNCITFHRIEK